MKDQPKLFGPEVPNYALLNEALKGKSKAEVRASIKLTSKQKSKPRWKRLDAKLPS